MCSGVETQLTDAQAYDLTATKRTRGRTVVKVNDG
jgi:hypothetical protein